jgi:hypothetical protein
MSRKAWVVPFLGAVLFACSSAPPAGFKSGETGSSSESRSDGGAASNDVGSFGSASSSGGSVSPGSPDAGVTYPDAAGAGINIDASIPTADVGQTVTLTADAFDVAPGAEVYKCQTFANPFGGAADIVSMHGRMSAGSHHFFLFNLDPLTVALRASPTSLVDCPGGGVEFHPFPYLSQQPDWTVRYPTAADGSPMGYPLAAANSLMINVHYLNSSAQTIHASVTIDITAAKPGVVTTHVGTLFLNQTTLSVPPTPMSAPVDESMTWSGSLSHDYSIFTSWSHMHKWSVDFKASTNGQVFYEEKNWDSPQLFVHPAPIPMTASQSLTWTCTYYNDTGSTLTFGDSAIKNVMCIYLGQYYPADPSSPDVVYVVN